MTSRQPAGVSVPSRGNGVIDLVYDVGLVVADRAGKFPSPLGEMGLSIRVMTRTPCITLWNLSFRPLSGIGGINLS